MGIQICQRCIRGAVLVVIVLSHREASYSQRIRDQDFQSIFGCHIRVLGWARAASDRRLARHRGRELSRDGRKCRRGKTASDRHIGDGEFFSILSQIPHTQGGWGGKTRTHARSS